jgi:uncharacterized protein (TIGR03067 family)
MAKKLPARPNLEHLKGQAKALLSALKAGAAPAAQTFVEHLPAARGMSAAAVRAAGFTLADAQSVIARQSGFSSWPALNRHVQLLRSLEGEWRFAHLEVDGAPMAAGMLTRSRLLIDGDRFRMESPEANYEGLLTIDAEAEPAQINVNFVEGPEAGNSSYGIFELNGDDLTLCIGLAGSSRPSSFATRPGSGHALERLRRASAARPANVTGGTPQPPAPRGRAENPSAFDVVMTPLLERLAGEWLPVSLVQNGTPMEERWLSFGSRTTVGNEVKVVFGGQTMLHAKMRFDERATPIAVDYFALSGPQKGTVTSGIMEWVGDQVRFLIANAGEPRPNDFTSSIAKGTLSQWKRR